MSQLVVGSRNIWVHEPFRPFEMDASAGSFLPPRAQRIREGRDDTMTEREDFGYKPTTGCHT